MFKLIAVNKHKIIQSFWGVYAGIAIVYLLGANAIISKNDQSLTYYKLGVTAGRSALVLFCIVLIPGISRRFGLRFRFASIIMWFRRQLGITVFLLAFMHVSFIRFLRAFALRLPILQNLSTFELFGLAALTLMFFLFITSNDISLRFLKRNWYRLQTIIYIVAWLLFGHTVLQRVTLYSILILIFAALEIISLLYYFYRNYKRKEIVTP